MQIAGAFQISQFSAQVSETRVEVSQKAQAEAPAADGSSRQLSARGADRIERFVDRKDRDGDGGLSAEELKYSRLGRRVDAEKFAAIDTNGDASLTAGELKDYISTRAEGGHQSHRGQAVGIGGPDGLGGQGNRAPEATTPDASSMLSGLADAMQDLMARLQDVAQDWLTSSNDGADVSASFSSVSIEISYVSVSVEVGSMSAGDVAAPEVSVDTPSAAQALAEEIDDGATAQDLAQAESDAPDAAVEEPEDVVADALAEATAEATEGGAEDGVTDAVVADLAEADDIEGDDGDDDDSDDIADVGSAAEEPANAADDPFGFGALQDILQTFGFGGTPEAGDDDDSVSASFAEGQSFGASMVAASFEASFTSISIGEDGSFAASTTSVSVNMVGLSAYAKTQSLSGAAA